MAFFTNLTCTLFSEAEETTNADGTPIYEIKAVTSPQGEAIPIILMVDQKTETGAFLKQLAELTKKKQAARVLITGVIQLIPPQKNDAKEITKGPKLLVYVAGARRISTDVKQQPEQAIVMGDGYSSPCTDFEDKTKRKPEVYVSSGNESLKEAGAWSSQVHLIADVATKEVAELFKTTPDGTEVYFVGNLFRSKGTYNERNYDNLKISCVFAQDTNRVKTRGGKRSKNVSMSSQLSDEFESNDSVATTMSVEELASQASISLADF